MTTGILINILNPKLSILFVAFLPQFVTAKDPDPLGHMVLLSEIVMVFMFVLSSGTVCLRPLRGSRSSRARGC